MTAALKYEWTRIRTIRSTYWISAIAIVLGVGLSLLISIGTSVSLGEEGGPSVGEADFLAPAIVTQFAAVQGPYLVAFILAIIAVFSWGHEYRHGMIRATLTAIESRRNVWIAKFVVLAAWTLTVLVVILLLATLAGWVFLHDDGVKFATSALWEQYARTLVYTLCFLWVAASAASLLRNQTAALVALFVWPLAVEPIVRLILVAIPGLDDLEKLSRYLPFQAGGRIIRNTEIGRALDAMLGGEQISGTAGFVVFAGFTAVLMAASFVLFARRDA